MNVAKNQELVITRVFNAPKKLVFETFTQAEHLKHWWGPVGMQLEVIKLDASANGMFHYSMKSPEGHEMFGRFTFTEVSPFDKIVFESGFADKDGNFIKAPFADNFPIKIKNTWMLEEKDGKTTLTMTGLPLTEVLEEINFFTAMHENMNQGFNGTFSQLEKYLETRLQIHNQLKTTKASRVATYLNFNGNTEEAFNFYKSIFGGDFGGGGLQRFGDIPPYEGQPPMTEEIKKMIIHAELTLFGGHVIMATDAPESMGFKLIQGNNMHINLEPSTKEETKRLFEALSKDGVVTMDLQDMFWGALYGSCTDKFGINWMFNCTNN